MNHLNETPQVERPRHEQQVTIANFVEGERLHGLQHAIDVDVEVTTGVEQTQRSVLYKGTDVRGAQNLDSIRVWPIRENLHLLFSFFA